MNTNDIQKYLLNYLSKRKHEFFVLTTNLNWSLPFESDVFQITKTKKIIEYEIKVSKSDFKKDFEKKCYGVEKHGFLQGYDSFKYPQSHFQKLRPHKFFFVVPSGLISKKDIPSQYGLIEVLESGQVCLSKYAKNLHNEKTVDNDLIFHVARNFCLKQSSIK